MKAFVSACITGLFAVDEKNKLIGYVQFKKDPKIIAEKLKKFESKGSFSELEKLKKKLKKYEIIIDPNNEFIKNNFRDFSIKLKFVKDQTELNKLITAVMTEKTKTKISTTEKRDKLIIQTVSAFNDINKILNNMSEHLHEWYGLHYPELKVYDHEKFIKQIIKFGKRENFDKFKTSIGMDLTGEDIEMLQNYSKRLKELYNLRKELENYLEKIVPKEIPNLCALLDAVLAARLLACAGSLEKLAKMPTSTIQLLGAEKALFKFLKDKKGKIPKHGIIFTHPDISSSEKDLRGKIARLLSSKLVLAARADFYSKKDLSKELKEDYKKKLKAILGSD